MKDLNILIVGGTGVISFAVVNEALKQGVHVTCINRGKSKNQTLPNDVEVIIADYRNKEVILSKLQDRYFDAIIDVLCYTETDIEYSVNLFKDKCDQYIFFSSCAVYNKGKGDYECTEDSTLINPVWDYSINKVKCERKLLELAKKHCFNYTIVRPAVTYGDTRIPYGVMPPYGYHGTLIQRLINGKPILLWDEGKALSTITRVEDFAVGLVGLLGNKSAYNQAVHIVGDERYTWIDVIDTLAKLLEVAPIYVSVTKEQYAKEYPAKSGEILGGRGISQLLDNTKIKKLVPTFRNTISLKEGLSSTIEYYQTHNYIKGIDWRFEGDTDRIIRKYCKDASVRNQACFVNYFGNAKLSDRVIYNLELHKDNIIVKLMLLVKRIYNKIMYKLS